MPCAYVTDLAGSIYKDIGSPSSITVSTVQSKLVSENFIGKLNVLLDECHIIVTGDISPALNSSEQAVYSELYKYDYYSTAALQSVGAIGAVIWTKLREGDSEVTRTSPNDIAKFYQSLKKGSEEMIKNLANDYKKNKTVTHSIDYYTIQPNGFDGTVGYGASDGVRL